MGLHEEIMFDAIKSHSCEMVACWRFHEDYEQAVDNLVEQGKVVHFTYGQLMKDVELKERVFRSRQAGHLIGYWMREALNKKIKYCVGGFTYEKMHCHPEEKEYYERLIEYLKTI